MYPKVRKSRLEDKICECCGSSLNIGIHKRFPYFFPKIGHVLCNECYYDIRKTIEAELRLSEGEMKYTLDNFVEGRKIKVFNEPEPPDENFWITVK